MFLPETEDMLPRAAPRPCAPMPVGHSDGIVKPTVPEVSLLFGESPQQHQQQQLQQQPLQQQQSSSAQRPVGSFASWKKQILPRVNFSPTLTTELGPRPQSAPSSAGIPSGPSSNEYNFLPRARDRNSPVQGFASNSNIGYTGPGPAHYIREIYPSDAPVVSQRMTNPSSTVSDVLTICASTQTEPESKSPTGDTRRSSDLSNLASKQDLREVLTLLEIVRKEQQELKCFWECLAQQQHQKNITFKDTAAQCDILSEHKVNATVKPTRPTVQDYIVEEEKRIPASYDIPARTLPQFQSPRTISPMAQSTGYRANTPKGKQTAALPTSTSNAPVLGTALPKPTTEKSMVMNELALKYLPQRQINELMDELHVSTPINNGTPKGPSPGPLRQIDNFTQSPSNISNASYKYLKKYRLLPEEQLLYDQDMSSPQAMQKIHHAGSPVTSSPQCQQAMLDLDNIRNKPKLI